MRTRYRSSNVLPDFTQPCQSRSTRSRSSGWTASSQPRPRYCSRVWPVTQRHSGQSSMRPPSASATHTIWAPPWTSDRYRSSLRRIVSSAWGWPATSATISTTPLTFPC